jgi:uncharacterized protein YecE (DUF72 family)
MSSGDLFTGWPEDQAPRSIAPGPRIVIGTSGYSFADWVGPFYPHGTRSGDFLTYYARHFDAVEVNSTYYRVPHPSVLERMEKKTPPGFRFVVKVNQAMTHERSLDSARVREFLAVLEPLKAAGKYDGLLAQFPWGFKRTAENESHLAALRESLPGEPLFVEFRHASWATSDLGDWLRGQRLGFCAVDEPRLEGLMPPVTLLTGEDAYVRFHGRNAQNWWGRRTTTGHLADARGAGSGSQGARAGREGAPHLSLLQQLSRRTGGAQREAHAGAAQAAEPAGLTATMVSFSSGRGLRRGVLRGRQVWPVRLARRSVPLALLCFLVVRGAAAGPPFMTDDPEPVAWHHWEFYLASQGTRDAVEWTGTAPHVEINYGLVPNVQIHVIAPWALVAPMRGRSQFGYGDTESGIKIRFVHETASRPQVGTFPILDLPTGSVGAGTGAGHATLFLPVWLQKSLGPWTTYGGGGYSTELGAGHGHDWFLGWEVQRQITRALALGGEAVHVTAAGGEPSSQSSFNLGMMLDFSPRHHLLLSAGRDLSGPVRFQDYAAYQLTLGPHSSE